MKTTVNGASVGFPGMPDPRDRADNGRCQRLPGVLFEAAITREVFDRGLEMETLRCNQGTVVATRTIANPIGAGITTSEAIPNVANQNEG